MDAARLHRVGSARIKWHAIYPRARPMARANVISTVTCVRIDRWRVCCRGHLRPENGTRRPAAGWAACIVGEDAHAHIGLSRKEVVEKGREEDHHFHVLRRCKNAKLLDLAFPEKKSSRARSRGLWPLRRPTCMYLRTSNPISVRVSIQKTINRPRNTECQCSHWLTEQRGEKAQNWHCQLLELSKLAVPRTDLFSGLNLYTGQ